MGKVAAATGMAGSSTAAQVPKTNPAATTAGWVGVAPQLGAASLQTMSHDEDAARRCSILQDLASCMEVCGTVARCAAACGSSPQLLGCAHLGCTTGVAGGLGSCEAALGVNRKGSVCGGCGVVRYCSAACAQQDWPGHRRVCRPLAAVQHKRNVTVA
jgi:hypothetical protein